MIYEYPLLNFSKLPLKYSVDDGGRILESCHRARANSTCSRLRREKGSARNVLPCLDLVVLGHGARELVVEQLQGGHVRQGGVQKVAAQRLVANVIDVVVAEKETSAEVIDPFHGGDTETLDAPQEILEGYQVPETEEPREEPGIALLVSVRDPDRYLSSSLPSPIFQRATITRVTSTPRCCPSP